MISLSDLFQHFSRPSDIRDWKENKKRGKKMGIRRETKKNIVSLPTDYCQRFVQNATGIPFQQEKQIIVTDSLTGSISLEFFATSVEP